MPNNFLYILLAIFAVTTVVFLVLYIRNYLLAKELTLLVRERDEKVLDLKKMNSNETMLFCIPVTKMRPRHITRR
jgi:hypothetical protein